jgi:hypothetical protein
MSTIALSSSPSVSPFRPIAFDSGENWKPALLVVIGCVASLALWKGRGIITLAVNLVGRVFMLLLPLTLTAGVIALVVLVCMKCDFKSYSSSTSTTRLLGYAVGSGSSSASRTVTHAASSTAGSVARRSASGSGQRNSSFGAAVASGLGNALFGSNSRSSGGGGNVAFGGGGSQQRNVQFGSGT